MVTLELLAALDLLLWLRTGDRAAEHLRCTQSTVSRSSRRCLKAFDLTMVKSEGEWELRGDQTLINLERRVHQTLRWREGSALRLDAQHWCKHWLEADIPAGWFTGNRNYFEYVRPFQLLQQGVIDAWVCSGPDVPRDPELVAVPFVSLPVQLVVKPGHPLLSHGDGLTFEALADYPVLPLPDGAFPIFQQMLEALGLWSCPQRDARFKQASWFGQVPLEEMMIAFETPLRIAAGVTDVWCPLPLKLPVESQELVMVRRDFAASPHLADLLAALAGHASALAKGQSGVRIHGPSAPIEV